MESGVLDVSWNRLELDPPRDVGVRKKCSPFFFAGVFTHDSSRLLRKSTFPHYEYKIIPVAASDDSASVAVA